ncbi:MAG: hypothetical protein IT374_26850 [Polyangiaceae bacterium]|nr:hypothetical protein [Polyangiaceae bacterium]
MASSFTSRPCTSTRNLTGRPCCADCSAADCRMRCTKASFVMWSTASPRPRFALM